MNKQSNTYTLIYTIILVVVVGAALAWVSTALKPQQQINANADKMKQILLSVHCSASGSNEVTTLFEERVTGIVVDESGNIIEGQNAFDIDVAAQSRVGDSDRLLPVFIYKDSQVGTKYILPMYGQGLWGPIWGYLSLNDDGTTVYGAYFSHQGETPGLGAEIEKPAFQDQFINKQLFKNDKFLPVTVVKAGVKPQGEEDYVDGVSGGTITSKGVAAMLDNCLAPYGKYLEKLKTGSYNH
ncbi:MAG: NADH:ubiquinone reductase (Na(+)-transporting) subunit C [Muribaculaceae bacterium]|nr:NADH:ubiquinone reductase (Na(+)-transporting) subunit C [Muribaculaceae bacterium]